MSDVAKAKVSLATIAACMVFICGLVFTATQKYDAIGAQMDKQHDQLAQIIDAQKDNHEWLVSLTQKVNDHDSQLSAIQESLHISAGKQDANAIRTKNIQHTLDSE